MYSLLFRPKHLYSLLFRPKHTCYRFLLSQTTSFMSYGFTPGPYQISFSFPHICFCLKSSFLLCAGQILMKAGLPIKFYTLDDSVMFLLQVVSDPKTHSRSPSTASLSGMYSGLTHPRGSRLRSNSSYNSNGSLRKINSFESNVEEVVVAIEESLHF